MINKSVNNKSKSNIESTINDKDKSKISIPKSPECNSSNLKSNKYTYNDNDNDNTELQTELKLPTNEEVVPKKSEIENSIQSKSLSPQRPLKKRSSTRINISRTNKVPESKKNKPIESEDEKDPVIQLNLILNPMIHLNLLYQEIKI